MDRILTLIVSVMQVKDLLNAIERRALGFSSARVHASLAASAAACGYKT